MNDLAQSATLVAAIIGASAAIAGVVVTSLNARRLAREAASAAVERESLSFRRQRLTTMKDMLFESAISLQSLSGCCKSISWLAKTPLAHIHEEGGILISRITYAINVIRAMGEEIDDPQGVLFGLGLQYQGLCSAIYLYKEQIDLANVKPIGEANAEAAGAASRLNSESRDWDVHLENLRFVVANICSRP